MKVSIALSTILAGLAAANVMQIKVSNDDIITQECCNTTPCIGGCPVHGVWRVSTHCLLCNSDTCYQAANTAGTFSGVVRLVCKETIAIRGCFSRCMEFSTGV
jgi:hypothetical protein